MTAHQGTLEVSDTKGRFDTSTDTRWSIVHWPFNKLRRTMTKPIQTFLRNPLLKLSICYLFPDTSRVFGLSGIVDSSCDERAHVLRFSPIFPRSVIAKTVSCTTAIPAAKLIPFAARR